MEPMHTLQLAYKVFGPPPLTSKGGTVAQNHNAAESYEATAVLYPNISAEYQSPSIICGGAATPAGCNSPYVVVICIKSNNFSSVQFDLEPP
eukprot:COSAG05_NODE_1436_length_4889_cov_42.859290_3_plen_92_part_00